MASTYLPIVIQYDSLTTFIESMLDNEPEEIFIQLYELSMQAKHGLNTTRICYAIRCLLGHHLHSVTLTLAIYQTIGNSPFDDSTIRQQVAQFRANFLRSLLNEELSDIVKISPGQLTLPKQYEPFYAAVGMPYPSHLESIAKFKKYVGAERQPELIPNDKTR
ncbi:MAG: hypothetical protein KDE51_13545 [Anaerolineales bacterium]|nr:hypothetical protein [Anaerolineales bacterium]